jgi:hypothetical protein
METVPVRGSFAVPELEYAELSLISYVKPIEKYLAFNFNASLKAVFLFEFAFEAFRKLTNFLQGF